MELLQDNLDAISWCLASSLLSSHLTLLAYEKSVPSKLTTIVLLIMEKERAHGVCFYGFYQFILPCEEHEKEVCQRREGQWYAALSEPQMWALSRKLGLVAPVL